MERTIPGLLFDRVGKSGAAVAHWWHDGDGWRSRRWDESLDEVAWLARALHERGVGPGVPVAIVSETRPEWTAVDLAVLCLGGITVGVYPTLTAEQIAYQLAHSEALAVIVENEAQARKIDAIRDQLPSLRHVASIERVEGLPSVEELRSTPDVGWLREKAAGVRPDDVATYIYTSGTTGNPKGAILTHANFWEVAHASRCVARVQPGDRSLVFLPLAHSLQRFTLYRGLIEDDVQGVYVSGLDALPEALKFGRPTILASVPRMLEKIRDRADTAARERGGAAHRIYEWAFRVGRRRAEALEHGTPLGLLDRIQVRLADRLVFSKVRERMGGQLRILVSGGAALDPEVARWYLAMGIQVLEGWGLTETSAPATANREGQFRLGTVGPPLPGVEVRVADDGELLVRGPGIFKGYLKDAEATAAALSDGWFHTGDVGTVDEHGYVRITDRKKEILVTAGGKNIPPVNIEKRIERSPFVSQAVVIGDARPYLVALLVPEIEAIDAWARQQGLPDEPLDRRLARPEVRALFQAAVDDANAELARFEQIKKHAVLERPFSVETGEITPTLKLKRRVIAEKYRTAIEAMYGAAAA